MEVINELADLLNRLKGKKITIKQVAEKIGYGYNTLRTEKTKKKPSQYVIDKIKEKYKKELGMEDEKKLPDYPVNIPIDSSLISNEGKGIYTTFQQEVLAELKIIRIENEKRAQNDTHAKGFEAFVLAFIEHTIDKEAKGNEQLKKEILARLEKAATKNQPGLNQNASSKNRDQSAPPPEDPAP